MTKENAIFDQKEVLNEDFIEFFDFDELEKDLQSQLDEDLSDLEFLKEEKEKIGNPDALGEIILNEIWTQFGNQIGLDMTNETLNQKYDREHQGETYDDIGKEVMQDPKYKKANNEMKEQQIYLQNFLIMFIYHPIWHINFMAQWKLSKEKQEKNFSKMILLHSSMDPLFQAFMNIIKIMDGITYK